MSASAAPRHRAVVIAHFHPRGRIALGLRSLVDVLLALPSDVVFVSTNVTQAETASLPPRVRVITRPNVGYDFESYRVGIEALGDLGRIEQLVLMNSSFVCFDAGKLADAFIARGDPDADILGLTASRAVAFHLQSYLVSFQNARIIGGDPFRQWWARMKPLSDRSEVIAHYEIGMSRHFADAGYRLAAAFAPDAKARFRAVCRWYDKREAPERLFTGDVVSIDLSAAEALNPVHFLWDDVLREFGVAKLELLQRNPHRLDLQDVATMRESDPGFRALLDDALATG